MRTSGCWSVPGALGALAALVACGHGSAGGGLPVSGLDVSCGPGLYISNGACVDLPPFSDASVPFDASVPLDAGEASSDAAAPDAGGPDGTNISIADAASDDEDDAPSSATALDP